MKIEDDISSLSVLYLFPQNSLTLLKVEEQSGHLQTLPTTDDQCTSYSIGSYSNNYIYYNNFQNHTLSLGVQSILHLKGINLKLKTFHQHPSDFSCQFSSFVTPATSLKFSIRFIPFFF